MLSYNEPIDFRQVVRFVVAPFFATPFLMDRDVSEFAEISADKLQHRHVVRSTQANGADVASSTELLHIAKAAGTVRSVEVRVTTAPTGGDKQFTVDVQKASDGSGSWTSLLTGVITVDSGEADDTKIAGTLVASPSFVEGDAVRVVVAASGSTGSQGQGVAVVVNLDESGILP